MKNYKGILVFLVILAAALIFNDAQAGEVKGEVKGELKWPKEWVVFAPLHRADPVLSTEVFRSVPESIHLPKRGSYPARDLKAHRLAVEPGKIFYFDPLFEKRARGNAAYVFFELQSPTEQVVTLGMGADWWMQVWLNGKEVFDTLETGNMGALPFSVADHKIDVPLKKGANVLVVRVISGSKMSLTIGGPDEIRTAEKRKQEREWAYRFNHLPEKFEDRMLFPVDEQAVAMACRGLKLPHTDD